MRGREQLRRDAQWYGLVGFLLLLLFLRLVITIR